MVSIWLTDIIQGDKDNNTKIVSEYDLLDFQNVM